MPPCNALQTPLVIDPSVRNLAKAQIRGEIVGANICRVRSQSMNSQEAAIPHGRWRPAPYGLSTPTVAQFGRRSQTYAPIAIRPCAQAGPLPTDWESTPQTRPAPPENSPPPEKPTFLGLKSWQNAQSINLFRLVLDTEVLVAAMRTVGEPMADSDRARPESLPFVVGALVLGTRLLTREEQESARS